jgi:outer membrane protein OmpA-like peptidoglycan-associated protein
MSFRTIVCSVAFVLLFSSAFAQQKSYYIVIGGFAIEENAQRFVTQTLALNLPAVYSMNPERKLFYVFVRSTSNKGDAYATLKRVQDEGFHDAWIFQGSLENGIMYEAKRPERIIEPTEIIQPKNVVIAQTQTAADSVIKEVPRPIEEVTSDSTLATTKVPPKPLGKPFRFELLSETTGTPLSGLVRLQEAERSPQYRGYNGNEVVYVVAPGNRSGKWYLVCQVIGFQEYKKAFNYANPLPKNAGAAGDQEIVIPVKLKRVKRGDYVEMEDVKFFNNASILMPSSERELNELLTMMQENPRYRIRLHGHTNGEGPREEIISLGESQNFFEVEPAHKRGSGTSKQLSLYRAETVKAYLVSKGIDGGRISVQGEGGKQMIFDPAGTNAVGNDRVEVEIVRH